MAESKTVAMVPLNSSNYLEDSMQDGLYQGWPLGIVNGTETAPTEGAEQQAAFAARKDKALAVIMLAVEPSLLY